MVTTTPSANSYENNGYINKEFMGFINEEELKG